MLSIGNSVFLSADFVPLIDLFGHVSIISSLDSWTIKVLNQEALVWSALAFALCPNAQFLKGFFKHVSVTAIKIALWVCLPGKSVVVVVVAPLPQFVDQVPIERRFGRCI